MTNAEAIVELRYQKKMSCMGVNYQANEEVIDMAISALEKQEGKKPSPVWPCLGKESTYRKCPVCGSTSIAEYCARCGQRIDWSDEHGTD